MQFNTLSAILRGGWLLDKSWADAHLPVVLQALKGTGTLAGMMDEDKEADEEKARVPQQVVSAGVVYQIGYYTDLSRIPDGSIAMIDISGPIMKYGNYCSYGSIDKGNMIRRADNAPNIQGIILNIDSPGGQVAGTTDLADIVKATKKPIIAVINDGIAASAAMWVASAADEIYVSKATDMVGSVGVYTTLYDYNAYLEKEGLKVHEVYAPQSKDKNADYREALQGNYEKLQEDLRVIADVFIKTVQANRAGKLTSEEWKGGKMFFGKDAQRIGLIDGVKSFDQVVKRMDQLISTNQQTISNKMNAFQKTLVAAKATSFAVVDGGFLLTEENLNAIEAILVTGETTTGELATATTKIETLENEARIATAAAVKDKERIDELQAEITKLQGKAASEFSNTTKPKDDSPVGEVKKDANAPFDALLDEAYGIK